MPLYSRDRVGNDTIYVTTSTRERTVDIRRRKEFLGSATTAADGTVTFNLTKDGTPSGDAIFTTIDGIEAIAQRNTTTAIEVPKVAIKTIAADLKQITLNVIVGTQINILVTPTERFAPTGTTVYITVKGKEDKL